jgi:hypothetical protein
MTDSNEEDCREYDVEKFDDAREKFHLEFPDDETRPRVFEIKVKHVKPKVV